MLLENLPPQTPYFNGINSTLISRGEQPEHHFLLLQFRDETVTQVNQIGTFLIKKKKNTFYGVLTICAALFWTLYKYSHLSYLWSHREGGASSTTVQIQERGSDTHSLTAYCCKGQNWILHLGDVGWDSMLPTTLQHTCSMGAPGKEAFSLPLWTCAWGWNVAVNMADNGSHLTSRWLKPIWDWRQHKGRRRREEVLWPPWAPASRHTWKFTPGLQSSCTFPTDHVNTQTFPFLKQAYLGFLYLATGSLTPNRISKGPELFF